MRGNRGTEDLYHLKNAANFMADEMKARSQRCSSFQTLCRPGLSSSTVSWKQETSDAALSRLYKNLVSRPAPYNENKPEKDHYRKLATKSISARENPGPNYLPE